MTNDVWEWEKTAKTLGNFQWDVAAFMKQADSPLFEGERNLVRDFDHISNLHSKLMALWEKTPEKRKRGVRPKLLHNWLVASIGRGNDGLGWQVPNLSPSLEYIPPRSLLLATRFDLLDHLAIADSGFFDSLQRITPFSTFWHDDIPWRKGPNADDSDEKIKKVFHEIDVSRVLAGQVLYVAMRFDGLLQSKKVAALQSILHEPVSICGKRLIFELPIAEDHRETWIPSLLTTVLMLRANVRNGFPANWEGFSPESNLKLFLDVAGIEISLEKLKRGFRSQSISEVNPLLHQYRLGRLRTGSLSPERTAALFGYDYPNLNRPDVRDDLSPYDEILGNGPVEKGGPKLNEQQLGIQYSELLSCLDGLPSSSWKRRARKNLEEFQAKHKVAFSPVIFLFVGWVDALLDGDLGEHSGLNAPRSIKNCISALGRRFYIAASGLTNDEMTDEDAWWELYDSVITAKKSEEAKKAAANEAQSFHDYLWCRSEEDIPDLNVGERYGIQLERRRPRAAYISASELSAVRRAVQGIGNRYHAQMFDVILLLCYRCGLRLNEATTLLCEDIDFVISEGKVVQASLMVRLNEFGRVKSLTSRRTIDLIAMLPAEELSVVTAFCRSRAEIGERGLEDIVFIDGPLFPGQAGVPITDEAVRHILLPLLKQATDDPSFRIHDLRHTAACNLLLAMREAGRDNSDLLQEIDGGDLVLEIGDKHIAQHIVGVSDRRSIWAVSATLGHASWEETVSSYVHVFEILNQRESEACLSDRWGSLVSSGSSQKLLAALTGLSRGRVSHRFAGVQDKGLPLLLEESFAHLARKVPNNRKVKLEKRSSPALEVPLLVTPLLSPRAMHSIAAYHHQRVGAAKIAKRVGYSEQLCAALIEVMFEAAARPASKEVTEERAPKKSDSSGRSKGQFKGVRTQFLSGSADPMSKSVNAIGEVPRLLASFPREKADQDLMEKAWKRAEAALADNGLWQVDELGEPLFGRQQVDLTGEQREKILVLLDGFSYYLLSANSTNRSFRFGRLGDTCPELGARKLLQIILLIVDEGNVIVKWKPYSDSADLSGAEFRRKNGIPVGCGVERLKPVKTYRKNWPCGLWSISLVNDSAEASYGLWYAFYLFYIMTMSLARVSVTS